jgi:UDPglucose 6-dehydrogenase
VKISVIGCGYLGAVHAACMAELGHDVVGVEIDPERLAALSAGSAPFHEPGLPELLARGIASGRLRFTGDIAEATGCEVHFLTVGTPQRIGSDAADLSYIKAAASALGPHLHAGDLVVGKSTVPVGTARQLAAELAEVQPLASLAWNPEFLREGYAVTDTLHPDRIVYGIDDGPSTFIDARAVLDTVYARAIAAGTPVIAADLETSELVKASANAFLAMKISFINAVADVCTATGADVVQLADAIGLDERIGRRFLGAGLGFGGGCLPKDIRAFAARATELGADRIARLLAEVDDINRARRSLLVELTGDALGGRLEGRRIAVLGLAFKPNSDDVRDSPALSVATQLLLAGADVIAYDPQAMLNARRRFPELPCAASIDDAIAGADAVLVLTEWDEFRDLDPAAAARQARGRIVVDGRNCLEPDAWCTAGWSYTGIGRADHSRRELFAPR